MEWSQTDAYQQLPPLSYPPPEGEEYRGRGVASRTEPPPDASFLSLVDQRVSVRAFRDDPIDDGIIQNALRVARLAPSAGNRQAYQVVIVRKPQQKYALAEAALQQEWIADAPVVLVFLADEERSASKYHDRGRHLYAVQDATIVAAYTQLALEAAGLASCWVGAFHDDRVAQIVGALSTYDPEESMDSAPSRPFRVLRPVVLMPVGVAAEHPHRHHRRAIREFVHHDTVDSSLSHQGTKGHRDGASKRKAREMNES
jgi:nitroreductase